MYELISFAVELVFSYCTDFVINLSNLTGLSYYEINTFIFVIMWPFLTAFLGLLFVVQKIRLGKLRYIKSIAFIAFLPFSLLLLSCGETSDLEYNFSQPLHAAKPDMAMLKSKAIEAKQYCQQKNLNTDFYILIDLSRHSGLKRFFVWDLNNNKITNSFLVSHGSCDNPWAEDFSKTNVKTSNVENSHCSSVGKYILGERGLSQWGIRVKYLMHGQEPTNNNATKRAIVFHSWERVSDEEVYPAGTPEGWGCPAISNEAMKVMDDNIKASDKRVLMWIVK